MSQCINMMEAGTWGGIMNSASINYFCVFFSYLVSLIYLIQTFIPVFYLFWQEVVWVNAVSMPTIYNESTVTLSKYIIFR